MSELTKVADEINEWAKWCHDNNVKAEVQRTMYRAADEIERLTAEVERLRPIAEKVVYRCEVACYYPEGNLKDGLHYKRSITKHLYDMAREALKEK